MSDAVTLAIFALLDSGPVTGLVSRAIYPDTAADALPSIVVQSISDVPTEGLSGPARHWTGRVSLQIRAADGDSRVDINAAVREALNGRVFVRDGVRARFRKAGSDVSRWSDDASVAEQVSDWYVSYSLPPRE